MKTEIVKIKGQHNLYAVIQPIPRKKPKFQYCGSLEQCKAASQRLNEDLQMKKSIDQMKKGKTGRLKPKL